MCLSSCDALDRASAAHKELTRRWPGSPGMGGTWRPTAYKYIYYAVSRATFIVRTQKVYTGSFATLVAAKKALAGFLKVTVPNLPRRVLTGEGAHKPSITQGVYLLTAGGKYEARDPRYGTYLGRFATEGEAVVAIRNLSVDGPPAKRQRNRREKFDVVKRRFIAVQSAFKERFASRSGQHPWHRAKVTEKR